MIKGFCLFIFLLILNNVPAQEVYLKHITIDDGLPSNEIYQVIQDEHGNLLAATDRGAVRFDGYSFETIKLNNEQSSYPVYYIYKSPNNKIFFSGLNGYLYQYNGNGLFNYPYNKKIASISRHAGILVANTLSEHKDSLWISYNNDFNYNFNIGSCVVMRNGEVKKLIREDGIYFDFTRNFFYRQLSNTKFDQTLQPVFITWKDGSLTRDTVDLSWPSSYIRRLFYEHVAGYEVLCIGRRLLIYKDKKKIGTHLIEGDILTFTVMDQNQIYLGLENGGAVVYELHNGKITGPVQRYLKDLTVTCIFRDNEQGIWFSTHENGLFYSYPSIARYRDNDSKIICIEKNKDKAYVGYRSGKIQIFSKGELLEQLQFPLHQEGIHNFSFYDDSLIVITNKGYYLKHNARWKFYQANDIHLLATEKDVVYGAASSYAELYSFKGLGGKMLNKIALPKRIISMLYDKKQQLWLGTWEGLYKYSNNSLLNLKKNNSVFKDRITAIKELPGNILAVSSLGNGLAVINNDTSYTLNVSNGLITAVINSMVVDGDNIWLGTNKGLTRVVFKNKKFDVRHFGIEAGLPTLDIHEFTIQDGNLYLKWINRLVTISLNKLLNTQIAPRVRISSVLIDGQRVDSLTPGIYKHNQNQITINFNSINLASANQQEYEYLLEGFDDKWNRTKNRFANYTNLSPGNYSFKVQVFSGHGDKPTDIAIYRFMITPAYWQEWWFFFIIIAGLLFLSYFILRLRIRSLKKKNQLFMDLAESQQKVLVQIINPHFIFNILNTVQGAILKQDKIMAASIISRFAKLMRLSMELSKQKLVSLKKEIEFLDKYFELESIRHPDKFSYDINVDPSINPSNFFIPSMLIQPFVENAIKHGITHLSDKKGFVYIKLEYRSNQLLCTIDDNGIGRKQSENINKNIEMQHQSTGIEITLNRLKLLHKEGRTNYVYEVKDKLGSLEQPEGTIIIFSLPFKMEL